MAKEKYWTKEKIMVYFIAFILISSVFGIMFSGYSQQGTKLKYNDLTFFRTDVGWKTRINNQDVFNLELKAIKKVRKHWNNLWLMIPFVRTVDEWLKLKRSLIKAAYQEAVHLNYGLWLRFLPIFSCLMN